MSNYWGSVRWNDVSNSRQYLHEAGLLKLNCDKALFDLQWRPTLEFIDTVRMTVDWYKYYYQNKEKSIYDFSLNQIKEYNEIAISSKIKWAQE